MTPDKTTVAIGGFSFNVDRQEIATITITYIVRLHPKYITPEILTTIYNRLKELSQDEISIEGN